MARKSLRQDLKEKDFVITAELNPPKGTSCKSLLENAAKIKNLVSAINVTDNSGANMKMSSLAPSLLIQNELDIEAIWQITCRDRNRLGLQSDLLTANALGITNILPLKGDDPKKGDHPETSMAFDIGTEDLLKAIQNLKSSKDLNENPVKTDELKFDLCSGSAAHPGLPDLNSQKETMLRRLDLGVEFFQTQICFDIEQINKFYESIGEKLARKTLIGITPLKTLGQAQFIDKNIFGVAVPEASMQIMETAAGDAKLGSKSDEIKKQQQEAGLKLAKELVDHIKKLPFKGIHIMAIGQESVLDEVIKGIV